MENVVGIICVDGRMQSSLKNLAYITGSLVRPADKEVLGSADSTKTNTTECISHVTLKYPEAGLL